MRSLFPGHFPLKAEELKSLWDNALIVFDANILLGLYRYSDHTRVQFLKTVSKARKRCWVPHRAAAEFFANKLGVINSQESVYEGTIKSLDDLEARLKNSNQAPFLSGKLMKKLFDVLVETKAELTKTKEEHSERILKDDILDQLEQLFEGGIGPPMTAEEVSKLCKEGEDRYKRKIPPGYKDAQKSEDEDLTRPYGDLLLWRQLLDKAQKDKVSVIFVCDDKKEDWWLVVKGKTIGPRPELVAEFRSYAGTLFHMYTSDKFLEHAGAHFGTPVSVDTVTEMRELRSLAKPSPSDSTAAARPDLFIEHARSDVNLFQKRLALIDAERAKVVSAISNFTFDLSAPTPNADTQRLIDLQALLRAFDEQKKFILDRFGKHDLPPSSPIASL